MPNGSVTRRRSHCDRGHPLSGRNVRYYHRSNGYRDRECVACALIRARKYQAKIRAQGRKVNASPEYFAQYRADVKAGLRTPKRRTVSKVSVPTRVTDLLQIEGSWWTKPEIAHRLRVLENTVQKALSDLTRKGVLTRRERVDGRVEWRASPPGSFGNGS